MFASRLRMSQSKNYEVSRPFVGHGPSTDSLQSAIRLLQGRRRPKRPDNAADPGAAPATLPNGQPSFRGLPPIHGMHNWLEQIGQPVSWLA